MRTEKDSLGTLELPDDVYYGIQSMRAARNFRISGTQVHPEFIRAYLLLKRSAAKANRGLGVLDARRSRAIIRAIDAILDEDFQKHFIVDAYQAGAGTSQNMNVNEVVANRANKLLRQKLGTYSPVHPNDHVNMSQSTNDTYPTAMRLTLLILSRRLSNEWEQLAKSFATKARQFDHVLKSARTHLQDAVPIRLGQEFGAYAATTAKLAMALEQARGELRELGIGGSAAGTGINVPRGYRRTILSELKRAFDDPKLTLANNMCEAMQSQRPIMAYSSVLRLASLELTRICNDLRLLSSGPNNGLAELILPATQPGSSIMPGKINPSILEMANQVLFKIIGNDSATALAMQAGQLELNVMMPLMAHLCLESTHLMINMLLTLRTRCIDGIEANTERCRHYAEQTTAIATALNPIIGYARAAELTKEALRSGRSLIALVRERKILSEARLRQVLNVYAMTEPR